MVYEIERCMMHNFATRKSSTNCAYQQIGLFDLSGNFIKWSITRKYHTS